MPLANCVTHDRAEYNGTSKRSRSPQSMAGYIDLPETQLDRSTTAQNCQTTVDWIESSAAYLLVNCADPE